jgi:MFS family permease
VRARADSGRGPRRRGARAEIGLALAGKAGAAFGAIGFSSLTPFVRSEFDLPTFLVGGIFAFVFLGALLVIVPAGRISDRFRPGYVLAAATAILVVGLAIAAVAPSEAVLFAGVAICGIGYGGTDPPSNVFVAANVSQRRRGLVMGISHTGLTLGGLLGGLVLPSVAEATSWRVAIAVPIAVGVLLAAWSLWVGGPEPEALRQRREEPVRAQSLAGIGAYGFVMSGMQLTILAYLAVYLVDDAGMTKRTAGFAVGVALAGGTVGRIAWGWFSDRFFHSRVLTLQLVALGSALGLTALAVVGDLPLVWPALFLVGFCAVGWNGVWIATASEMVPSGAVGAATATVLFFAFAGSVAFPPSFGAVVDAVGSWSWAWAIGAAIVGLLVVTLRLIVRRPLGLPP